MLTRSTPGLPSAAAVQVSGNTLQGRFQSLEQQLVSLAAEHNRLLDAVRGAFEGLNREGALDIADAAIVASRGIKFPATQNASADVNTLDDYKEVTAQAITVTSSAGTITTVGTANISYTKAGREILWQANITITTNGTGSGYITFTFPFTVVGIPPLYGANSGGVALSGYINGTGVLCTFFNGTYPGADGAQFLIGGRAFV